jgi:DeoR/GlpR family transcriptional regulator of sugar metabolism
MKPKQRQAAIAEPVRRSGGASIEDLASQYRVSIETIRRDLGQLAEARLVETVHGWVRRSRLLIEGTFQERLAENSAAKDRIDGASRLLSFVDTTKFQRKAAYRVRQLAHIDVVVSDRRPNPTFAALLEKANVELV